MRFSIAHSALIGAVLCMHRPRIEKYGVQDATAAAASAHNEAPAATFKELETPDGDTSARAGDGPGDQDIIREYDIVQSITDDLAEKPSDNKADKDSTDNATAVPSEKLTSTTAEEPAAEEDTVIFPETTKLMTEAAAAQDLGEDTVISGAFCKKLMLYLAKNMETVATPENLIGHGSSSDVYKLEFCGKSLALKRNREVKRYKREIAFYRQHENGLAVIFPKVYMVVPEQNLVVMELLSRTLRAHLDGLSDDLESKTKAQAEVVCKLFNAVIAMHEFGIQHGNLHLDNIMLRGDNIVFVDLDEAESMRDFGNDLMRLRLRVLPNIKNWRYMVDEKALDNPAAYRHILNIFDNARIALLFSAMSCFDAPDWQNAIYRIFKCLTPVSAMMEDYNTVLATGEQVEEAPQPRSKDD